MRQKKYIYNPSTNPTDRIKKQKQKEKIY